MHARAAAMSLHRSTTKFAATFALTLCALMVAPGALAQNAVFAGTVLIDPSEKPLSNAEVMLPDLNRSIRSDSAGNFQFTGLPAGRHKVIVRMLGYESFNMDLVLTATQKVEADLMLKASTTTLATVDVSDKAASPYASRLAEFEDRRKSGGGRFITGDVFAKEDGRSVSAIITQRLAGVKIAQENGRRFLASNRIGERRLGGGGSGGMCYAMVVVNGVMKYNGRGNDKFDIDQLEAKDILGFEYHSSATIPSQYNMTASNEGGSCGMVIIWTKAY